LLVEGQEAPAAAPAAKPKAPASQPPGQAAAPQKAAERPTVETEPAAAAGTLPAGPAARRLARELGVDLGAVRGSGPRGRITPEDVEAAGKAAPGPSPVAKPAETLAPLAEPYQPVTPPGETGKDNYGPVRRDRVSKIRQTIAAQMVKSSSTIPHVTNFDDADVTDLEAVRRGVPQGFLGSNAKLTMMPFVVKACALALRRHPLVNASLDVENQQIVYKEYVNIGIAVDTPRGLVVPVLKNADRLTIPQTAAELAKIAQRARAVQFAVEDLRGGTFTISNLGAVGGTYSTPIINHPEVAILLVGRARLLPAVREGRIEPRLMMPLSLSYDHRLVDGAAAGRFLNEVIDWLQSPGKLLLVG
jgi:pyruvate dehydrogenase E2 component (dihydrolipoamide acetyltransferase)